MTLRPCTLTIKRGVSATSIDWSKYSRTISMQEIIHIVCQYYKIDQKMLNSPVRKAEVVKARHQIMYLAYKYSDMTLVAIGNRFNRDHTTVIHAKSTVQDLCDTDEYYRGELASLERIVSRRNF